MLFCEKHKKAYEKLVETYKEWRKAMGVSWKEYLNLVARNQGTGLWVIEVAEYLVKKEK